MRKFLLFNAPLVLVVALTAAALAASPVARIGSNVEEVPVIEPGDPLEFTADSITEKEKCKWKVTPSVTANGKPTFRLTPDKKGMTLYSRAGSYKITLYVWNDEDLVETSREVLVGAPRFPIDPPKFPAPPKPPEQPKVDTPADPVPSPKPDEGFPGPTPLGLGRVIKDSMAIHVPISERPFALKLAESYRQGAKNIVDGTWTLEKAIKSQRDLNVSIPGYQDELWSPVFKDIADVLGDARESGRFTSKRQFVAIWAEISMAFASAASTN